MIFVTVGTHEQSFDRLLAEVDRLTMAEVISTDVIIQSGYSAYVPIACSHKPMMGYREMEEHIQAADIVITHGGPGSIFGALKQFKIPIVVPRHVEFNEHVDRHQVEFAQHLQLKRNIIPVFDIRDLEDRIVNYPRYIEQLGGINRTEGNLGMFVQHLNRVVTDLMESR